MGKSTPILYLFKYNRVKFFTTAPGPPATEEEVYSTSSKATTSPSGNIQKDHSPSKSQPQKVSNLGSTLSMIRIVPNSTVLSIVFLLSVLLYYGYIIARIFYPVNTFLKIFLFGFCWQVPKDSEFDSVARAYSVTIFEDVRVDWPIGWVITLTRSAVCSIEILPHSALIFDCFAFLFENFDSLCGEVANASSDDVFVKHCFLLSFSMSIL